MTTTITSAHGVIKVPVTIDGRYYVLGPVSLPQDRDRTMMDAAHAERLTTSATKAKRWAERMESWLLVHGKRAQRHTEGKRI